MVHIVCLLPLKDLFSNPFSLNTYYADQDEDNYGNSNSPILACVAGPGMVAVGGDCDDGDFDDDDVDDDDNDDDDDDNNNNNNNNNNDCV